MYHWRLHQFESQLKEKKYIQGQLNSSAIGTPSVCSLHFQFYFHFIKTGFYFCILGKTWIKLRPHPAQTKRKRNEEKQGRIDALPLDCIEYCLSS